MPVMPSSSVRLTAANFGLSNAYSASVSVAIRWLNCAAMRSSVTLAASTSSALDCSRFAAREEPHGRRS